MDIKVDTPILNSLKNINKTKITVNSVATILLVIIMIVIPILFLPYVYNQSNQLLLTCYFTVIALISFLIIKIYEYVKFKRKIFNFKKIKVDFVDICLIIYSVLIFLSCITSEYFPDTIFSGATGRSEGALTLYLYIILFYIAYKAFKFDTKFLPYMATSTLVVSCVGIVQSIALNFISHYGYMAYSSFGNPNFFSSYLSLFLPIYMIVYLKKKDNFYLITSIVTFMALVCTMTSGGYITFIIYSLIILIYALATKVKLKNILTLFGAFTICFILLNLCTNNAYINETLSISTQTEMSEANSNNFANGRGLIYNIGLKIVKENPLLGIGPDSLGSEVLLKYYFLPEYTSALLYDKAHSEYLQIAICTGIPSLIIYLIFICTIAINLLKKFFKDTENVTVFAVGMSIFAYLVQAVPNISVTHVAPMFWIMLGIGLGLCKNNDEVKE